MSLTKAFRGVLVLCALVVVPGAAWGQWDPSNGEWGKSDANDIRIMTFNLQDGVCRTAVKTEAFNSWCAIARLIAAMKPDILYFQEAGDNSGNGTGSGVDSVAQLEITIDLLFHGGSDPYNGGTVGAWVQKYDPNFDMPYVFVSDRTDNYNRNVILSRFPFGDLNGDGISQRGDISTVLTDEYAGGNGGIRGFMFAELDLPDATYVGNLVVGNAHLKAGTSDHAARVEAAQNVAYYIDYLFNGAGTGVPDPHNKIVDYPAATDILDDYTPVIIGGDWNEDESKSMTQYGSKGPAAWLTQAQDFGGTDGTDRDRSDMAYDNSVEQYTNDPHTISSSKFDYIAWQGLGLRPAAVVHLQLGRSDAGAGLAAAGAERLHGWGALCQHGCVGSPDGDRGFHHAARSVRRADCGRLKLQRQREPVRRRRVRTGRNESERLGSDVFVQLPLRE